LTRKKVVHFNPQNDIILAMRLKDEGRLLWLRIGNCRTTDLLSLLNRRWPEISQAFEDGRQIVEVR